MRTADEGVRPAWGSGVGVLSWSDDQPDSEAEPESDDTETDPEANDSSSDRNRLGLPPSADAGVINAIVVVSGVSTGGITVPDGRSGAEPTGSAKAGCPLPEKLIRVLSRLLSASISAASKSEPSARNARLTTDGSGQIVPPVIP